MHLKYSQKIVWCTLNNGNSSVKAPFEQIDDIIYIIVLYLEVCYSGYFCIRGFHEWGILSDDFRHHRTIDINAFYIGIHSICISHLGIFIYCVYYSKLILSVSIWEKRIISIKISPWKIQLHRFVIFMHNCFASVITFRS